MRERMTRRIAAVVSARLAAVALGPMVVLAMGAAQASAAEFGPSAPVNPYLGPAGTATMHGDAEDSDTTPLPGPGVGPVESRFHEMGAACPTILQGRDGFPQALCTVIVNRTPTVFLLDPATDEPLASLPLGRGGVLGGVYAYLDGQDRMVTADGAGNLLWVAHDHGGPGGRPRLFVQREEPTAGVVTSHCGAPGCDHFSSVTPDQQGRVWFATEHAAVGVVDPVDGVPKSVTLPTGELVENSISSAPEGVVVSTDHAVYLLRADASGAPHVVWRRGYDRGPWRKPGRLSWGTGSTPAIFGPHTGSEYIAITDNAWPRENLVVLRTDTGAQVCKQAVLPPGPSGTENAPIGSGRTVIVASTYGYPYPAGTVGPSTPATAPFTGGMTRVDVDPAGTGCTVRWNNEIPSAAVPRLSTADGRIYTFTRRTILPGGVTTPLDGYGYAVVDADTGRLETEQPVGRSAVYDTLQMVGFIGPRRVQYQGTMTGFFRVAPR